MDIKTLAVGTANKFGFLDAYAFLRRRITKSQVAILIYHRVNPKNDNWSLDSISPNVFEEQMDHFSRKYEILSLEKLAEYIKQGKTLPKKAVAVTFDDGYLDNYRYAYHILKKYHIPATIFLITGHISSDKLFWWDKVGYIIHHTNTSLLSLDELGDYSWQSVKDKSRISSQIIEGLKRIKEDRKNILIDKLAKIASVDIPSGLAKETIMSWEEIKEMNNQGISFGAHSVNHPILTKTTLQQAQWEIIQSKKDIEKELGNVVNIFSYPNGDFNLDLVKIIKEYGFGCAVSVLPGKLIRASDDVYTFSRIGASEDSTKLKVVLSGFWEDLRSVISRVG